jgi:hypothetical protein
MLDLEPNTFLTGVNMWPHSQFLDGSAASGVNTSLCPPTTNSKTLLARVSSKGTAGAGVPRMRRHLQEAAIDAPK